MSEPSPEAKQYEQLREGDFALTRALAEDAGIPITASDKCPGTQWEQFHDGVMKLRERVTELENELLREIGTTAKLRKALLDLAEASAKETVKAREELTECQRNRDRLQEQLAHQQPSALVREKWEAILVAEVKRYGGIPYLNNEELEFREAMAEFLLNQQPSEELTHDEVWDKLHKCEQPSAPTADVPQDFIEGMRDIAGGRVVDLDTALTKPFPPTADVEKIALRLCENLGCTPDSMAYVNIRESLAQARAPLVEALVLISEATNTPAIGLQKLARAALAGTGKKISRVKGGEEKGEVTKEEREKA